MRAEARLAAGRDDHVIEAAAVGPAVEDEGLLGKVLQREPGALGERMARREGRRHVLVQELVHGHTLGIDQARADEGDVQPPVAQAAHHIG